MSDLSDQMGVLARQAQAWAEHAGEALRAAFGAPTERDRLANLISDAASAVDPGDPGSAHAVADAVLDAGYQRHGAHAGGRAVTTGCTASLTTAAAVHDCDWTEPHPGHAHHNHQAGATWTGATWRDLATLRAEVEALRTLASGAYDDAARFGLGVDIRTRMGAYKDAYDAVLDLIDKHAREGQ